MTALLAFYDWLPRWLLIAAIAGLAVMYGRVALREGGLMSELSLARHELTQLQLAVAEANTKAANQAAALQQKVIEAQNEAKIRETALRNDALAARSELDGLYDDIDKIRGQLAGASAAAATERAVTIGSVLQDCSRKYQELAAKSDQHVNDLRTVIEAWPRTHMK